MSALKVTVSRQGQILKKENLFRTVKLVKAGAVVFYSLLFSRTFLCSLNGWRFNQGGATL